MTVAAVHPGLRVLLDLPVPGSRDTASLIPGVAQVAEWEQISRQAAGHGLAFLLHRRLRRLALEARLPPHVWDELQGTVRDQVARNLLLARELTIISQACERAGVPCVPLRGPALAEHLHGDPAARASGDLDLLVQRERLTDLAKLLSQLGFSEVDHRPDFARTFSYTLSFMKDRQGLLIVEPHWTLAYPPFTDALDMARIWHRCRRGRILGMEGWCLSLEDLLIHLCLHLLHAGESAPLLWYLELDGLIRRHGHEIDWSYVIALVERGGLRPLLAAALERLRAGFDCPLPTEAQAIAGGRSTGAGWPLALLAGASTLSGREEFAQFCSMPGLRPRLIYAASLLFPSREFMSRRYAARSRWRLGLCYLARLIRIAGEGCRWGWALVRYRALRLGSPRACS